MNVFVTGADRGLGRALCLAYHARGEHVIAAEGLIRRIDALGPDTPPEFRHANGTLLPW